MLAIVGGAGLGEDFEIDEAHGHEAEGEAGHQAGEEDQEDDDEYVDEEIGAAAFVFDGHSTTSEGSSRRSSVSVVGVKAPLAKQLQREGSEMREKEERESERELCRERERR